MKKLELEEKKLAMNADDGLGQILVEATAFIAPIITKGGSHDFVSIFCDGAWLHFPIW